MLVLRMYFEFGISNNRRFIDGNKNTGMHLSVRYHFTITIAMDVHTSGFVVLQLYHLVLERD